ncbi:alpha-(1-_3)-arabinofuranosyltransferase domain-containing protein [Candidatus Methanoperedens nitratireducens]|nr:alpha-(1->3)-arabinofuranosyltransferase family protein [Candidatus Methanoperedens nitroreducens]
MEILTMQLSNVIPAWLLQKIYLILIIFLSGISMHSLIDTKSSVPKYFGGILYAVNPFVYVRFLAGHWLILLAYSIMPFAVKSFLDFLDNQNKNNLIRALLLTALTGALNSHILTLLILVYLIFLIFKLYQVKNQAGAVKNLLKSLALLAALYLSLSLYWLLPLFTANATVINQISQADIYAFATGISAFNAVFTIASMYGFWREGYIYTKDFIPHWYLLFFFILFLAIHGFISNNRSKVPGLPVKALGVTAVVAVILGSGIHGPFSSLFEFLFNNIFFFRGLRDSHKFAALIALSYSYLGALGVAEFEKIARSPVLSTGAYKKTAAWLVIVIALVIPFIYSFTMFNGFWGQLEPTDYPGDWYDVNKLLNGDSQDFNVLFLPWHQYMNFKWIPNAQKRIANPASSFFDKPIIQGENAEIDLIYSQSTNPAQRYVESLLGNKDKIKNFGELIIPLNVKYVLLTKEVDYKEYFFLFNQTDLELIKETGNFYIFKNAHPVSRFYISSLPPPSEPQKQSEFIPSLKPSDYTQVSPVKFSVNADAGYVVFVPPNLDSEWWELDGRTSTIKGFYAVYPAGSGMVYYRRFDTYLVGYLVSIVTLIGLIIWHYRKDSLDKTMNA